MCDLPARVVEAVQESKNKIQTEGTQEAKEFIKEFFEGPKVKELDQRVNRLEKIIDAFLMAGAKE